MGSNVFFGSFDRLIRHRKTSLPEYGERNATLELLKSSVLVAFSGAIRIHLAFLLLHLQSSLLTCIAGGLVIYAVYTIDRALGSEEDAVNRKELNGSKKEPGLLISLLTFLIGSYILAKEGLLLLAFIPFVTGYLYSKGIKIGKFAIKLKGGAGVKNLVVGVTWGVFIAGLAAGSNYGHLVPVVLVFIFFAAKLFVNSAIYDFKDLEGDTLAGIKTLPVSLGTENTRNLLTGLHFLSHLILGVALINGIIAFEPLILLCSFVCGLFTIQNYTKCESEELPFWKLKRTILVDGESSSILGLKIIAGSLLA
jgi:4-hydroxybenzoate polyprenyltransferase